MKKQTWVYDEENLSDFHCTVFYNNTGYRVFEISKWKNELPQLQEFLRTEVKFLWGYNNHFYDDPILEQMIKAKIITAEQLYQISQDIISNDKNWVKLPFKTGDIFKLKHFDRFGVSLKWCEVMMDLKSIEEMPIKHYDSVATQEDAIKIVDYCKYDCEATYKLIKNSQSDLDLRAIAKKTYNFGWEYGMSPTALGKYSMLKDYCKLTKEDYYKVKERRTFHKNIKLSEVINPIIKFESKKFKDFYQYLLNKKSNLIKDSLKEYFLFDETHYDLGKGGLHGVQGYKKPGSKKVNCKLKYESNEKYKIIDFDWGSFYPLLAVKLEFAPNHLDKKSFCKLLNQYTLDRFSFKSKSKDKSLSEIDRKYAKLSSDSLKIKINSIYGLTGDKNSPFFDLKTMYSTTVNGQLLLLMLIEKMSLNGFKCFYANTDGATFIVEREQETKFYKVCEWMYNIIDIPQEFVDYDKCFIADVNNYVIKDIYGNFKLKGRYVYENIPYNKNNSNRISSKAAVKYLTEGVPISKTIKDETNIFNFCKGIRARNTPASGKPTFILFQDRENYIELQDTTRYIISNTGGVIKSVYSNGTENFIEAYPNHKGSKMTWKQTVMNKINSEVAQDYDINYIYYQREANKLIDFTESKDTKITNQLKLF